MGIKERREREKKERRGTILDIAEAVFLEKGYSGTTMDEVASRAELSKGTLYLYYNSKEELYLGVNLRALRKMYELFTEAFSAGQTGLEKIRLIGEAYFKFAEKYPSYFDALLYFDTHSIEKIRDFPLTREYIELGTKVRMTVSGTVEHGLRDGSIRAELQPELTGMLLWALSSGFIQFVARKEDIANQQVGSGRQGKIDAFFDLMIHALQSH
jgi:AcrR family transcriptional regulator